MPPKAAEDYKVNVPEALAEKVNAEELAKDPMVMQFLKDAHANGFTQKQVDMAIGAFLERAPGLAQGAAQLSTEDCTTALRQEWKTDQDYQTNIRAAYRAAQTYGEVDKILERYGNDPDVIKLLANVGKELNEDTSAPAGAQATFQADVETLTKSKAYMDPTHPEHLATKQKVEAMFQRAHGTGPKRNGPIVIPSA